MNSTEKYRLDSAGRCIDPVNGKVLLDSLGNPVDTSKKLAMNYPGSSLMEQFNAVAASGSSRDYRPIEDKEFVKFHLAITADEWTRQSESVVRKALRTKLSYTNTEEPGYLSLHQAPNGDLLEISRVQNPTYRSFMERLRKVGHDFGWDARKKYQNVELVESILGRNDTVMLSFICNGVEVGFTTITGIQKTPPNSNGAGKRSMTKGDAIRAFSKFENERIDKEGLNHRRLPQNPTVLEVYKFGMYSGNTSESLGHYFLPAVLEMAFHGEIIPMKEGPEVIYLDTRDTNPIGTLKFYLRNGLSIFSEEVLSTDLEPRLRDRLLQERQLAAPLNMPLIVPLSDSLA